MDWRWQAMDVLCVPSALFLCSGAALSELNKLALPACAVMDGGGAGRVSGFVVCFSVLSSGFSHNEYTPLRLESCRVFFHFFSALSDLLREDFTAGRATQRWSGWVPSSAEYFVIAGRLWNAVTLYIAALPLTLAQLLSLPLRFAQWGLQPYPSLLLHPMSTNTVSTTLHVASISVLPPCSNLSPLFTQIHTPSDVSMHGSQICLC